MFGWWVGYWLVSFLGVAQAVGALWGSVTFARFIRRWRERSRGAYWPRAAVLLPCKGIDPDLGATIERLAHQNYEEYRVYCTVESRDDPAHAFIEETIRRLSTERVELVVGRLSAGRAQKIENLLAGIDQAGDWPAVYAFVDSDAVPGPDWLADLVAPLAEPSAGAATGYRWYEPGRSLVSAVRCIWNIGALTFLGDHNMNFCWGGSTAIRRETFERTGVRGRWERALSEDYQINRAVRDNGLRVVFTPDCVIPSDDDVNWWEFLVFARRQLIITRVCEPKIWWLIAGVSVFHVVGFWLPVAVLLGGLLARSGVAAAAGGSVLLLQIVLASVKILIRDGALMPIVRTPGAVRASTVWDLLIGPLVGTVNLGLMVASGTSRRFRWRGVEYAMDSPLETRVLGRKADT